MKIFLLLAPSRWAVILVVAVVGRSVGARLLPVAAAARRRHRHRHAAGRRHRHGDRHRRRDRRARAVQRL